MAGTISNTEEGNEILRTVELAIPDFESRDPPQGEFDLFASATRKSKNDVLLFASRSSNNKFPIVKFLIEKCHDLDINYKDRSGYSAAEYAWDRRHYDILLLLLKTGSCFPENFDISIVEDNSIKVQLENLIKERNDFHEFIKDGKLEEIDKFCQTPHSRYYLNLKNESALFTAIKEKKLEIYANLRFKGVKFLNKVEKIAAEDALVQLFVSAKDSHIHYLISKSRSPKPVDDLGKYYEKLDEIPEVSIIMKVIQYCDYFDIIFDFDNENIKGVYPTSTKFTRGELDFKNKRVYIAAKREEKQMLGTLAHELAHLAMEILFQNDCNPYNVGDEGKFEDMNKEARIFVRKTEERFKKTDEAFKILSEAQMPNTYICLMRDYELIVRVPHILTECENGKEWLEENVPKLLKYYNTVVIAECEKFLKENFYVAKKREIRSINETFGELKKLQFWKKTNENNNKEKLKILSSVQFQKEWIEKESQLASQIKISGPEGSPDKNIFLITTDYTLLGMINVLQSVFGAGYVKFPHKYLTLEYNNFMQQPLEILRDFYSEICPIMIIRFLREVEYSKDQLKKGLDLIEELLQKKPHKKIVLIADSEMEQKLLLSPVIKSSLAANKFKKIIDKTKNITLKDLAPESKTEIISKEILFEGVETKIETMVGTSCEETAKGNLHELISADIIERILEKKDVCIGNQTSDVDNLEGTYIFINEKIDEVTFALKIKESNDIFIINGIEQTDERKSYLKNLCGESYAEEFLEKSKDINSENITKTDKRIIITENRFTNDDFKNFCRKNNRGMKIYLIEMTKAGNGWTFNLQQIYNPNFCLPRRFETKVDKKISVFTEEELVVELNRKKAIILADKPGTGKSTTMNKLLQTSMAVNHWVIKLYPNKNIKNIQIKKFLADSQIDKTNNVLIELLKVIKPKLSGAQKFLKAALDPNKNFGKYPLFVFDGLDEILDEDFIGDILKLLKYLRQKVRCKIWVTARLHLKKMLENKLSTKAFSLVPLDEDIKSSFIKNYLQNHFELTFPAIRTRELFERNEVRECEEKFLQKIQNIFSGEVENVTGIPLHLYLMLEEYKEILKKWASQETECTAKKNILKILESFIYKKYRVYFKKLKIDDEHFQNEQTRLIENYHRLLAWTKTQKESMDKNLRKNLYRLLLLGLVHYYEDINSELKFLSCTFQEYYFALEFTEMICGASTKTLSTDENTKCNIINERFCHPNFILIRKITDLILLNFIDSLPENIEKIQLFWLITDPGHRIEIERMLCTAVVEKNNNIFFLISFIQEKFPEKIDEKIDQAEITSAIFSAIDKEDSETIKSLLLLSLFKNSESMENTKLLTNEIDSLSEDPCQLAQILLDVLEEKEIIKNLTERRNDDGLTLIQSAACEGRIEVVKKFVEIGKKVSLNQELFQMLSDSFRHIMAPERYNETIILTMLKEVTNIFSNEEKSEFISSYGAELESLGRDNSEIRAALLDLSVSDEELY